MHLFEIPLFQARCHQTSCAIRVILSFHFAPHPPPCTATPAIISPLRYLKRNEGTANCDVSEVALYDVFHHPVKSLQNILKTGTVQEHNADSTASLSIYILYITGYHGDVHPLPKSIFTFPSVCLHSNRLVLSGLPYQICIVFVSFRWQYCDFNVYPHKRRMKPIYWTTQSFYTNKQ